MPVQAAQDPGVALPTDLAGWLDYIDRQHASAIELGLDRVARVTEVLRAEQGLATRCPVITVGGTNGKGSTCAMLESILRAAGYRVGLYTSPHLVRYNERVRLCGREADDDTLCEAFAAVEVARRGTPLTYFEFGTLAAWVAFARAGLDVLILEIGLGGRLDAVNLFDPDCAVLTSVAMDHMEYLGPTREAIGWEKAHIFRAGRPAICSDPEPPATVTDYARAIGADLWLIERDFGYSADAQQWRFWSRAGRRPALGYPGLRGTNQLLNASAALAALATLRERLPVSAADVRRGLSGVQLPGRFQVLPGRPTVVLDVAHNPQAAGVLAANLALMSGIRSSIAVFGALRDKDIEGIVSPLRGCFAHWMVATLPGPRGSSAAQTAAAVQRIDPQVPVSRFESVEAAYAAARAHAGEADRIVVFGSFLMVAAVLSHPGR
jgi:dihydrofolate synthase/folylpolyglutamate synthase